MRTIAQIGVCILSQSGEIGVLGRNLTTPDTLESGCRFLLYKYPLGVGNGGGSEGTRILERPGRSTSDLTNFIERCACRLEAHFLWGWTLYTFRQLLLDVRS